MTVTNKKPKLFGSKEESIGVIDTPAVADIIGDITYTVPDRLVNFSSSTSNINMKFDFTISEYPNNQTVISKSGVTTPSNSILIITVGSGAEVSSFISSVVGDFILLRDSEELDTFKLVLSSNSTAVSINTYIDTTPTAGTHTYSVKAGNTPASKMGEIVMNVQFIQTVDTHQGVIVTPATATKQIITEDTHFTKRGVNL